MGTVIEAQARITAVDATGDVFNKVAEKFKRLGKGAKASVEVEKLAKSLERANGQLAQAEKLEKAQASYSKRQQQFADRAKALAAMREQMSALEAPSRRMEENYRRQELAVDRARQALRRHRTELHETAAATAASGVPIANVAAEQRRLRSHIEGTTAALNRQVGVETARLQRRADRRQVGGMLVGGALVAGAHQTAHLGRESLVTYREFDKYSRQTKAFGNFSDEEMRNIVSMAIRGGANSKYNDIQWLQGAKALGGRGVKAGSVMSILPEASHYGQAMGTDLPRAVAALEAALFTFQRDLSTPEKARAAARRSADIQVNAAKSFGLTDADLQGGYEYGGLQAQTSGLSEEKLLAFLGLGKKLNIPGEAQGNAFRAMISKFLAPTQKGREALAAVGVDYAQFQRMPASLSVDNFSNMIAQQYGVKLNAGARGKLSKAFGDKSIFGDSGAFAVAVREALQGQVGIKGAKDLNKVAGSAERFRRNNVQSIDTNGLMDAVMKKIEGGNLALANAIFGEKQGNRIMAAMRDQKLWSDSTHKIESTPEGKAETVEKEMMGGFDGAASRFEGAKKNLETAVGRAFDNDGKGGLLTKVTDKAAHLVQSLAELDSRVVAVGAGMAGIATILATWKGTSLLLNGFGLKGSAVALDASAAALTRAALLLAGEKIPGGVPGGATPGKNPVSPLTPIVNVEAYKYVTDLLDSLIFNAKREENTRKGLQNGPDGIGETIGRLVEDWSKRNPISGRVNSSISRSATDGASPSSPLLDNPLSRPNILDRSVRSGEVKVDADVRGEVTGRVETTITVQPGSELIAIPQRIVQLEALVKGALASGASGGVGSTTMPHYASPASSPSVKAGPR